MLRSPSLAVALFVLGAPLSAQAPSVPTPARLPAPVPAPTLRPDTALVPPRSAPARAGIGRLAWAGTTASVAGALGGAGAGWLTELLLYPCRCDDPGLIGVVTGWFAGPALLVPWVVHRANGRRGSLWAAYAASAVVAGAGFVALATGGREAVIPVMVGVPVAQAVSAVTVIGLTSPD